MADRRYIRPYKVRYDEGCEAWVVLSEDDVEQDYFDTRDEAMDAAVRHREFYLAGTEHR